MRLDRKMQFEKWTVIKVDGYNILSVYLHYGLFIMIKPRGLDSFGLLDVFSICVLNFPSTFQVCIFSGFRVFYACSFLQFDNKLLSDRKCWIDPPLTRPQFGSGQ